jgi:hypothetical protein
LKIGFHMTLTPWARVFRIKEYEVFLINHKITKSLPLGRSKEYNKGWAYSSFFGKRFISIIDGSKY